jgi:NADH-quinone oxidoreductase subunit I
MGITARESRRKAVTLQYPHERPELSTAYRSAIKLVKFEESQTHDCIACMQCVHVCPSFCITIEGEKPEGIKRKRADRVEMDFALCSLCGLCIDVCPTDTLEYSKIYDEAGEQRNWKFDLIDEFRDREEQYLAEQREKEAREAAEKEAQRAAAAAAKEAAAKAKAAKDAEQANEGGDATPPGGAEAQSGGPA